MNLNSNLWSAAKTGHPFSIGRSVTILPAASLVALVVCLACLTRERAGAAVPNPSQLTHTILSDPSSYPSQAVAIGDTLFFDADDGVNGDELWKSDGTVGGTSLVLDINPSWQSSYPENLTVVNGVLFFTADDGVQGSQLWKSDGTAAGTRKVQDSPPGFPYPSSLVNVNGTLFFVATDPSYGTELWKSDGTSAGTVVVKDINPGFNGSYPNELVVMNNMLFFQADDGVHGPQLWKSDGTEAGTVMVKEITPEPVLVEYPTVVNGVLLFRLTHTDSGTVSLWKSDGTQSGTVPIPTAGSSPVSMVNVAGTLFLSLDDPVNGRELWKSDGTSAGTVLVKDINPGPNGSYPDRMTVVGRTLYFVADDGVHGQELWKSDGTAAGTVMVRDIYSGSGGSAGLSNLRAFGGLLFFAADDGTNGAELWRSDGTAAGTLMVKDLNPGPNASSPGPVVNANGVLYFTADDGIHGSELFATDGTAAGTHIVADIASGIGMGDSLFQTVDFNGWCVFAADDGVHGTELWLSDGSPSGTKLLKDLNLGAAPSFPSHFTVAGNQLYFGADDGVHGTMLWKTDGSSAGTVPIAPGFVVGLGLVGSNFLFVGSDAAHGSELWKSDGTANGTGWLKDINQGTKSSVSSLSQGVAMGGNLFFSANDGTNGEELWISDATSQGTKMLKDINLGTGSSDPYYFTSANGWVFFFAQSALWKTDGSAGGTVVVKSFNPGSFFSAYLDSLVNVDGTLFFVADDGVSGVELWKSDGSTSGTLRLKDINPGANGSYPYWLTPVGSTLFFVADDGVQGQQLWKSDGTTDGTTLVRIINPGGESASAVVSGLVNVNGTLFFSADDGVHGPELWKSDGTADGTIMVQDIYTGQGGSNPDVLTSSGGSLFFTAGDGFQGRQLYSLVPEYSIGQMIPTPTQADLTLTPQGPSPVGGYCWNQPSGPAFALLPGFTSLTWSNRVALGTNQVIVPIHQAFIIKDLPPATYLLGQEIPPPAGATLVTPPVVTPADAAYWHAPTRKLYATGVYSNYDIAWGGLGCAGIHVLAQNSWPAPGPGYQTHVANTLPVPLTGWGPGSQAKLLASDTGAGAQVLSMPGNLSAFSATGLGRSLILESPGNPSQTNIYFQFVQTIAWDDPGNLHTNAAAVIGQEITNTYGFHDWSLGAPYVMNPLSRYCAQTNYYDRARRTGPIIPVNQDDPSTASDDMVLICYQAGLRLLDPVSSNLVPVAVAWPYQPVRYDCQWPLNPSVITIADGNGTGAINPAAYQNWAIYAQNDPTQPGFNPNDEHALIGSTSNGSAIFALRDDLSTPTTSQPYVLMTYLDGGDSGKPKMKVFKVQSGTFQLSGTAGDLLQAPLPLSTLQNCQESDGYSGPYWRDRKLNFWIRSAGDDGGPTNIVMRYWYPIQPGFYFPSNYFVNFPPGIAATNIPPGGAHFPWLDIRAGTPKTPINVTYSVTWPQAVPELRVRETLVHPKYGLPDIGGQTSAEILYQQSLVKGGGASVNLIDPTAARWIPLAQLPDDVTTANNGNLIYFPTLPPQLRLRFHYDTLAHQLSFNGQFVQPAAGEYYVLLNTISSRELQVLKDLSTDPGWAPTINSLGLAASNPITVPPNTPFNSPLALTASGGGAGYVTLAFNNSTNLNKPDDPISLAVIMVDCDTNGGPYQGELKAIKSDNPLDEQITIRHTGDFGGQADQLIFDWKTLPPGDDGLPQTNLRPDQWNSFTPSPASGQGALDITISGPGLFTLSDNYFICRYRSTNILSACSTNWSAWTQPQIAEGWIKRVLNGINPFEQRFKDYQSTAVNTIVSMLAQAGPPFQGVVPLNADAANKLGLIEIYETVLRRGMGFSISGSPPVDYAPANDALLLAASRLSDLYMLEGNEAFAEASDPTIVIPSDAGAQYVTEAPSIHCFENQTATRLEEELKLLRGRDATLQPSPQTFPFYNRLIWNYTHGINGGEVAYSLKFDIHDVNGDGQVDENDASAMYPMGHGDAWGHYLSALKGYYLLLRNPYFTWVPRIEATLVGGVPVSIDYLDERKFAQDAAARAQTGAEIVNLTYRDAYSEDPGSQWQGYQDSNTNRAWGVSDWGCRAGQGALFDWAVGNAMLPPVSAHTGIQKIDRTTVTELRDVASAYLNIQDEVDKADAGLNPLGLAKNVVPFDIDPNQIANGNTHFEQIYGRAVNAMNNALAVFKYANNATQSLRQQADQVSDFQKTVNDREADFTNRLIEIFGYPYSDDIGPTGTYRDANYQGPDLYHYMYSDPSAILGVTPPETVTFVATNLDFQPGSDGSLVTNYISVTYHLSTNGFGLVKPATWTGSRRALGQIQMAHSDLLQAKGRLDKALADYENLIEEIEDQTSLLQSQYNVNATEINVLNAALNTQQTLNNKIEVTRATELALRNAASYTTLIANATAETAPKIMGVIAGLAGGVIYDPGSFVRGPVLSISAIAAQVLNTAADAASVVELDQQQAKEEAQAETNIRLTTLHQEQAILQQVAQIEQLMRQEAPARLEIYTLQEALQQAAGHYSSMLAQGQRLLEDRLRFRQETAAQVQTYRYKDMAFRIFRNDALQKYRAQFDLAAMYVYLAAVAYDFETNLKPGDPRGPGSTFMTSIVKARSIGLIENGIPIAGGGSNGDDPGLADPMARMNENFQVLKGQLEFNNPQTQTQPFSLRSELFRIQGGAAGNKVWRDRLTQLVVSNILQVAEFKRYCIPFNPTLPLEPGIVIPFDSTVTFGENFFGWPAGSGDHFYDSSHFATKVRSVGVWFVNYNNTALVSTPYVYLVPVGSDILRCPGTDNSTREWKILDQQLPVPFKADNSSISSPGWDPMNNTLSGQLGAIRQFASLLAYNDSGSFNSGQTTSSSRLIGRSVWNTQWVLIIPAGTLLSDRNEALQRFINGSLLPNGQRDGNGVTDIKIFFQTYSYAGN